MHSLFFQLSMRHLPFRTIFTPSRSNSRNEELLLAVSHLRLAHGAAPARAARRPRRSRGRTCWDRQAQGQAQTRG
jgi:hypothetical protein